MSYATDYDLFTDVTNDLHKKVARAIDKAARDVINEDPGTSNHARRLEWANRVRQTPDNTITIAHKYMLIVLDNATVAAAGNAATDTDVQFVVNSLVDLMAS